MRQASGGLGLPCPPVRTYPPVIWSQDKKWLKCPSLQAQKNLVSRNEFWTNLIKLARKDVLTIFPRWRARWVRMRCKELWHGLWCWQSNSGNSNTLNTKWHKQLTSACRRRILASYWKTSPSCRTWLRMCIKRRTRSLSPTHLFRSWYLSTPKRQRKEELNKDCGCCGQGIRSSSVLENQ